MPLCFKIGFLMKSAFIYSPKFSIFDYGPSHPMKTMRLKLCYNILEEYGIFKNPDVLLIEPPAATREEILLFHDEGYINALMNMEQLEGHPDYEYNIGNADNPAFRGVYEWSALIAGASINAARLVGSGKIDTAFNIGGGLHHAMPAKAAGFCYINDTALAILDLLKQGKRVVYIDIDAHHGDGVQHAFYNTDKVLTISLHESGEFLFPKSGFVEETGEGEGEGYSVNLPFYPGTGDDVFTWGFDQVVPPLIEAFKPDVIVTQLGVDNMETDPLAHLSLTTEGFCRMVEKMKAFRLPWVALGGGGYDITNVARAWALAFGIMSGVELPADIPKGSIRVFEMFGYEGTALRDKHKQGKEEEATRKWAEEKVRYIHEKVFPVHGIIG